MTTERSQSAVPDGFVLDAVIAQAREALQDENWVEWALTKAGDYNEGALVFAYTAIVLLADAKPALTTERQALDRLLRAYPEFDLLEIDWKLVHDDNPGPWREHELASPWLLVVLGQRSIDGTQSWARHHFAIWKPTGAIHGLQDGAVTDDPIL